MLGLVRNRQTKNRKLEMIMLLFNTIDSLFKSTRFGVWGLAVLGILASIGLAIVNVPLGLAAFGVCVATLFLSIGITLLLLPSYFEKKLATRLPKKEQVIIASLALGVALVVVALAYFSTGGFPELNLLFA
jgi:hypothetical protein